MKTGTLSSFVKAFIKSGYDIINTIAEDKLWLNLEQSMHIVIEYAPRLFDVIAMSDWSFCF